MAALIFNGKIHQKRPMHRTLVLRKWPDVIPLQDRATWQGVLQLFSFFGQLIGGALGGLLVDRIGWRWYVRPLHILRNQCQKIDDSALRAFTLELPVAIAGAIAVTLTVRLPPLPTQTIEVDPAKLERLRPSRKARLHVPGTIALSASVAMMVIALSIGGNDVPWSHPVIPILISLSLILLVGFAYVEIRVASTPLLPVQLLNWSTIWPVFAVVIFKDMAGIPVSIGTKSLSLESSLSNLRKATVSVFTLQ